MEKIALKADSRKIVGRKVKTLRREGLIPASIYGKDFQSQAVVLNLKEFQSVFTKAGETGLVDLQLEGKGLPVLIHTLQYHPVTGLPLHVDLYKVNLKQKVTAKVPLVQIGESPAVKDRIGALLTLLTEIEVEALPADLPDKIEVDIAKLAAIDKAIKVGDLKIPTGIKILVDVNLDIVKIGSLVSKEAEKMVKEEAEKAAAAAAATAATAENVLSEGVKKEEAAPSSSEKKAAAPEAKTK